MSSSLQNPELHRLPPQDGGWKQTMWSLFGALAMAAMLAAAAWWTLPPLVSDWQVRNSAVEVPQANITKGKCSAKLFFHNCSVTLSMRTPTGTVTRDVNYVFVDVHSGSYSAGVMADPARPDLVTTDLALDKLWNRTITLLIVSGLLLVGIIAVLVSLVRNRRNRAEAA